MNNFVLIGAAGHVAPFHFRAIKDTGNDLLAALDKNDSVGILDSFFPEASFFTEFERFDRHIEKIKRSGEKIEYLSICTPNYLHDAHIRFGLRHHMNVICEKPLVLKPYNAIPLKEIEKETGKKVFTVLQLRKHPDIIKLKEEVDSSDKKLNLKITYITPRGNWYYSSWKGKDEKSGGITMNIGIHFFDILCWIFGAPVASETHLRSHDRSAGYLEFAKAEVTWFLSINPATLPEVQRKNGTFTYRAIEKEGEEIAMNWSQNLHTEVYKDILKGEGTGIDDACASIEIVDQINSQYVTNNPKKFHPLVKVPQTPHPFYVDPKSLL
jgi:UDP-N-acetyl-2-amino-2-deoxyglucuronate dehydrogenase